MMVMSVEELRCLLRVNAETGELFWLERPRHMFKTEQAERDWNSKYIGARALKRYHNGYRVGEIGGVKYFAHRVVWALHYGEWPKIIDHINHDRSDNRVANLRNVTQLENIKNSRLSSRNKSGYHGVRWDGYSWAVTIGVGRTTIRVGNYKNKSHAVAARKAKERELGYHENHGTGSVLEGLDNAFQV